MDPGVKQVKVCPCASALRQVREREDLDRPVPFANTIYAIQ